MVWKERRSVDPDLRAIYGAATLAEALMLGHLSGGNPAPQRAGNPEVIKPLTVYNAKMKFLAVLGMGFEPSTKSDLTDKAVAIQARQRLLTNDSVILAMALRPEADVLVSADRQFHARKKMQFCAPSDIQLRWTS